MRGLQPNPAICGGGGREEAWGGRIERLGLLENKDALFHAKTVAIPQQRGTIVWVGHIFHNKHETAILMPRQLLHTCAAFRRCHPRILPRVDTIAGLLLLPHADLGLKSCACEAAYDVAYFARPKPGNRHPSSPSLWPQRQPARPLRVFRAARRCRTPATETPPVRRPHHAAARQRPRPASTILRAGDAHRTAQPVAQSSACACSAHRQTCCQAACLHPSPRW